jgi:hypothetical protein
MSKQLTRIAPWQAGKLFAFIYFIMSIFIAIPFALLSSMMPSNAAGPHLSPALFIAMPFIYAIFALIFIPIGCWVYNLAARVVGGLEVSVTEKIDA